MTSARVGVTLAQPTGFKSALVRLDWMGTLMRMSSEPEIAPQVQFPRT